MDKNTLLTNLAYFTGSIECHKWSGMYPRFFLTDGAQFLAENAGAYWLMDLIGSYQPGLIRQGHYSQAWTLKVYGSKGFISCLSDGRTVVTQEIPYTDFPLDEITLYAAWDGDRLIICLPSED